MVQYRNVWYRPLASRWDNTTHSTLTADENEVMALRRKTAELLFARIKDPSAVSAENVKALAEVVSYAKDAKYVDSFKKCLDSYRAQADKNADDVKSVNGALAVLRRNRVMDMEPVK